MGRKRGNKLILVPRLSSYHWRKPRWVVDQFASCGICTPLLLSVTFVPISFSIYLCCFFLQDAFLSFSQLYRVFTTWITWLFYQRHSTSNSFIHSIIHTRTLTLYFGTDSTNTRGNAHSLFRNPFFLGYVATSLLHYHPYQHHHPTKRKPTSYAICSHLVKQKVVAIRTWQIHHTMMTWYTFCSNGKSAVGSTFYHVFLFPIFQVEGFDGFSTLYWTYAANALSWIHCWDPFSVSRKARMSYTITG